MQAKNKMNLTNKRISKLVPSSKREVIYDARESNLALAVNPSGRKTFLLVMSVNNRTVKRKLGSADDLDIEDARIACAELRASIRKTGEVPESNPRSSDPTVFDLYDAYMTKHARKHLRSWRTQEQYWRCHLSVFKSTKASDLSIERVTNWFHRIGETSGRHMANRALSFLSVIYNKAIISRSYRGANPTMGIKRFTEKPRERYLKDHELEVLNKALRDEPSRGFQAFIRLSLLTGARFSNVVGMKWRDLDLNEDNPTWTIPAENMKNNDAVTLPLTPSAVSVIMEFFQERNGEFVLHDDIPMKTIKRRWRANFERLVKRAGIDDLRIHDLRRTFGSKLAQSGVSLQKIAALLGQNSTRATPIYARLNSSSRRAAIMSIEGYFPA